MLERGFVKKLSVPVGLALALAACTSSQPAPQPQPKASPGSTELQIPSPKTAAPRGAGSGIKAQPAVYTPDAPLQCVPFARANSGIEIYGDAYTWWNAAAGRYPRGSTPRVGAVVQLKVNHSERGHLAVVTAQTDSRTLIVDHANWLNRGQIHRNTPMVDVSPDNDWSQVRVWYTPGGHLGGSTYPVVGFIYPSDEQRTAWHQN